MHKNRSDNLARFLEGLYPCVLEDGESGGDIHFYLDYEPVQADDRAGLNMSMSTASCSLLTVSHLMGRAAAYPVRVPM